ncbi:MAG TPA: FAD-dependent oxidoreductase [Dehalococcoidales bacterium]|nr:FAD-dependent oxidoreductase [Dehalococcoidales bacterium]
MGYFKNIFTPVKIGKLVLKNRIELPPIGPLFGSNLPVTREHFEWGRQFARGGVAIVTMGDNSITPPENNSGSLSLASDQVINPLSIFAETIQRYGAAASIQLNYRSAFTPTNLPSGDIPKIIRSFSSAAWRCYKAGMQMIMLHGAHGQLISQFVSPRKNLRQDAYGGTLENRTRLVNQILDAIREKVGDNLAIEYRISADEFLPDGLVFAEQLEFVKLIQNKIDLLHVSAGVLEEVRTLPRMIQPTYLPRGLNINYASRFKKELKIPVTTVGSINLDMAEKIISENEADVVALGRCLIADPDAVKKAKHGLEETIRPCIRCNSCIERTHTQRLPIRCAVNPAIGRETEYIDRFQPCEKKKIVVIGGGPAGMEAAGEAAGRGNEVVLFEREPALGGTLKQASAFPFKEDMKAYLDWAIRTILATEGVTIKLSTPATPQNIKAEKPDKIIIAVGAEPFMPPVSGLYQHKVFTAGEIPGKINRIGENVVVAGAGLTGLEAALFLAINGKRVKIIDTLPLEKIGAGSSFIGYLALMEQLRELEVEMINEVQLEDINDTGVVMANKDSQKIFLPCDSVVLALGVKINPDIIHQFSDLSAEVTAVGDCNYPKGNLFQAIHEGYLAAMDC